ncbi:MAG TPA: chemotaxis protein CheD [Thermodesulfobacteriota bacterium]|nr:chemotaxis protein CheD [Thermodesulfobacteriota bacterium]
MTAPGRAGLSAPPSVVRVGMGEFRIAAPPQRLLAYGLGSCVAVIVCDAAARLCGLAHVMLPGGDGASTSTRFADVALERMVAELLGRGAARERLVAKLVGGANMFPMLDGAGRRPIGERNVQAVRERLGRLGIPVVAADTGGSFGRTVEVDPASAATTVRSWHRPPLEL